MSIKLSRAEINHIIRETDLTDHADPFGEIYYLLEFVDAQILRVLRERNEESGQTDTTEEERRELVEKLLTIGALDSAYRLFTFERQTGLIRKHKDLLEKVEEEIRAEITAKRESGMDPGRKTKFEKEA